MNSGPIIATAIAKITLVPPRRQLYVRVTLVRNGEVLDMTMEPPPVVRGLDELFTYIVNLRQRYPDSDDVQITAEFI
ncbi:hypothetical protein PLESTB_000365600 [Pleodorina starrii]|uniref:Uncharacterized protein n=1 Tax=Pleodorina starrii TaxID=330485 RepID=A0A9W6BDY3_9CHLO|nr:hypothetical protein PLESTB_000365600 [Pleodorina starrii]